MLGFATLSQKPDAPSPYAAALRDMSLARDSSALGDVLRRLLRDQLRADLLLILHRENVSPPDYRLAWLDLVLDVPVPAPDKLPSLGVAHGTCAFDALWKLTDQSLISLEAFPADDLAGFFTEGYGSALALPVFERGEVGAVLLLLRRASKGFRLPRGPAALCVANLLGRAVYDQARGALLARAFHKAHKDIETVGVAQKTLLPPSPPTVPGVAVAAAYRPAEVAGGDYYDFFELPGGDLGILVADACGHGTPAAVLMAITHALAHVESAPRGDPAAFLSFLNRHLVHREVNGIRPFVTAVYCILSPSRGTFRYVVAGHPAPHVLETASGTLRSCETDPAFPLGIDPEELYTETCETLGPGQRILLFTDGIQNALAPALNAAISEALAPGAHPAGGGVLSFVDRTLDHVRRINDQRALEERDDCTLVAVERA